MITSMPYPSARAGPDGCHAGNDPPPSSAHTHATYNANPNTAGTCRPHRIGGPGSPNRGTGEDRSGSGSRGASLGASLGAGSGSAMVLLQGLHLRIGQHPECDVRFRAVFQYGRFDARRFQLLAAGCL